MKVSIDDMDKLERKKLTKKKTFVKKYFVQFVRLLLFLCP